MLKLISRLTSHSPLTRPILDSPAPFRRVINSLRRPNLYSNPNLYHRAFFCSSSDAVDDVDKSATAVEADAVEDDGKNAILPTVFRPDECFTVLALPLPHRPLFPGFYMPIYVKDPKLLAALEESRRRQAPFAGAFLVKDEPDSDPDKKKNIYEYKGKELLNRLHEVGTLGRITAIQGEQVILVGLRRLRITEMVEEYPLTVKVDHLKDLPYDNDDDVIKATSFEVISTVRDVLHKSSLWRDHVQTYTQHIGEFNYPRLADFGAAISGANRVQGQQVLEELDVLKRLQLSLELVKK